MAEELLETYVRQLIEAHGRVPVVQVAWQGGEPTLMGLEFFRRSVELVDSYLKPGQRAEYTIRTNGTKLDAHGRSSSGSTSFSSRSRSTALARSTTRSV